MANEFETNGSAPKISLAEIRENPAALRSVDKTNPDYLTLVDSIRLRGVLNPVVVRRLTDPDTGKQYYALIDGLHRFTAAQDAGLEHIPVNVITSTDAQVLEDQIIANVQKIETKPVEYTKGLQRLMAQNPFMTVPELSAKLCKSPAWVSQRMSLIKLLDPIGKLVDEGKINLSNAYCLAKLPEEDQLNFLERAISMNPKEFAPTVEMRVKEVKEARREGRKAKEAEFQPVAFIQNLVDVKSEMDNPQIGPYLVNEFKGDVVVPDNPVQTAVNAFNLAVKWFLHLDPKSVEAQRAKDQQRREEEKAKKEERAQQRKEKKALEAKAAYEKAQAELEGVGV